MLQNEQIILFGFPKWEGDYMKSTVHLARELAKHNQVLYVDYPFTWGDVVQGMKGKPYIPVKTLLGLEKRLKRLDSPNLHLLRMPPILPMNWVDRQDRFEQLARWNARWIAPTVKKAARELGFDQPIVINAFLPALGNPLRGAFNEKLLVYYCYDEIGSAPWISKHGPGQEAKFMQLADLVVTSSVSLYAHKAPGANAIGLVKNGVDINLFGREALPEIAPLSDAGYQKNIGYLGSFDSRVDIALLSRVIEALPHAFFSFVGRIVNQEGYQHLSQYPNVKFYGPQPVDTLPAFIEQFNVGIIPFVKNELTAAIYPLKVNEYLARATPVVATDFADLSDFTEVISLAPTADDFIAALYQAGEAEDQQILTKRVQIAAANSWENRGRQFGALIKSCLATKKRKGSTENRIKSFSTAGSSIFEERNRIHAFKAIK